MGLKGHQHSALNKVLLVVLSSDKGVVSSDAPALQECTKKHGHRHPRAFFLLIAGTQRQGTSLGAVGQYKICPCSIDTGLQESYQSKLSK